MRIELVEHDSKQYNDTVGLRDKVLRKPLGLSFSPEQLAAEFDSIHVVCYFQDELAGCLVLQPDSEHSTLKMRQVAVSEQHQGLGIGRAMVEYSEQYAKEHAYEKICLHARDTAVGFYLKLGYEAEGEPFEEVGIPHRYMFKLIT